MKSAKYFQILLLIVITFLAGYYAGVSKISLDWKNYRPTVTVSSKEPPQTITNVNFSNFWTVWQSLENKYYDKTKLDPQKLLNGAISGMVQSIGDPYTAYLPPVNNTNFKEGLAGQFQGIGAELGLKDKQVIVVAPLDDSPAQKAGIKAGDAILKVDNKSTEGWSLSQAVEKIRGPKETFVVLNILHKDTKKPTDIKIKRGVITVKSVSGFIKKVKEVERINLTNLLKQNQEDKIIYIRLSQFGDNTNRDWLSQINDLYLKSQNDKSIKGIILDLRNNPGGYLTDATFIAGEFLKEGKVVVVQEDGNGEKTNLSVNRRGIFMETPLLVLINKGSASASEIVSGALRDYNRAKLVGETSFGKGTIQEAQDIGDGAGLHVTIAKWLTPNGTWVHEKGLKPDIEVSLDPKDQSRDTQLEKAIEELVK
ncbi:MAG: S41 family peptidase [Candidatus Levybacteria bacterium]|nr:S41 family peptidase [Candidatus Levybacteria bacterium]